MTGWRKSSHSGTNAGGECVEVAPLGSRVAVRDSTDPAGPRLYLERAEWSALLTRTKRASL